jgi:hypothetical protein
MRWLVVDKFEEVIKNTRLSKVTVVGGTSKDPEVETLLNNFSNLEIYYFGIDNPHEDIKFKYFDLNLPQQVESDFSLVICSQVLEHIHNLEVGFKNLTSLVNKSGGYLWINCPASNFRMDHQVISALGTART